MDQIELFRKRKDNIMIQRTLRHSIVGLLACFMLVGCEDKSAKEELNKKLDEAKASASKAKDELQKAKDSLGDIDTAADKLKEELAKVTNSLNEARSQITTITKAREKLQLQVDAGKAQIEALQGNIKQINLEGKKAIEEVMKKFTGQTSQLEQVTKLADSRGKENNTLKEQIKNLQATIDDLKKKATQLQSVIPGQN
jgi:chromosome segregation ATPase